MLTKNSLQNALLVGIVSLGLVGCRESGGAVTYPVNGTVVLESSEPALLAGHNIEIALESDPAIRAFAEIQPDGHFELNTLHEGTVHAGAIEGVYRARIILSDDDALTRKQLAKTIDPKALMFDSTPFVVQVPADDPVLISVKRR